MDNRQPIYSDHVKTLAYENLRRRFLDSDLFMPDTTTLTYSKFDRIIIAGIVAVRSAEAFGPDLGRHTGTYFLLQRQEMGLINIWGSPRW